ncbi:hypothetical protein C8R46DRAFT_1082130 [Mycena filopes]|nr:hypothetical protein C8R46DRAFT_1082130 [Mycena filopes]
MGRMRRCLWSLVRTPTPPLLFCLWVFDASCGQASSGPSPVGQLRPGEVPSPVRQGRVEFPGDCNVHTFCGLLPRGTRTPLLRPSSTPSPPKAPEYLVPWGAFRNPWVRRACRHDLPGIHLLPRHTGGAAAR